MSCYFKTNGSFEANYNVLNKTALTIIAISATILLSTMVPIYSTDAQAIHSANISISDWLNSNFGQLDLKANSSSKSYAVQIMMACQVESNDNSCPVMSLNHLDRIVDRQLVLATFLDLILLYDNNNYSCHHEGHSLGMWLYTYTASLDDALKYSTIHCSGSIYHGVFQSYFEDERIIHNLNKNQITIKDLCPVGQENVNWLHERDCIHAIGHGLTKLYKYNTTAAVDRCNDFVPTWAQSACSRGVFMENTEYFIETGHGDFDTNDIYSPCDRTIEKFTSQCYYYYPTYDLVRTDLHLSHNLTDAFAKCDNISPVKFSKYCYQGIDRLLETIAYTNAELSIAACYLGNQTKYHNDCLLGTLKTILKGEPNPDLGFEYCSKSKVHFKAFCYEVVGMWIKAFFQIGKVELESECAKALEVNYVLNCMKANQTTGLDVLLFEPL
ncbi:MAG TPA: hypothetical protein VJR94_00520 [Candidatus Nitrosocosmicus sp.]|nr:hypothetical protein [Candidatus Nitrosocosmicus sp.]